LEIKKKVWDVNILAIYLVEDHPGNEYVSPIVEEGLRGEYIPILPDILPIRAYLILERKWNINKKEAMSVILEFLKKYDTPRYVSITKETLLRAFELSEKLKHDVYDCVYLALAEQERASAIITTDTDFEELCRRVGLEYENPVPLNVLKKFHRYP